MMTHAIAIDRTAISTPTKAGTERYILRVSAYPDCVFPKDYSYTIRHWVIFIWIKRRQIIHQVLRSSTMLITDWSIQP